MRSIASGIITAALFIIILGAVDGSAQIGGRMVADVPFDFHVAGKLIPAGKYEFIPGKTPGDPNALVIRTAKDGEAWVPVATVEEDVKYGAHPVIVFRRYGSEYFLSSVHNWPANVRLRMIPERKERRLQRAHRQQYVSIKPVRV